MIPNKNIYDILDDVVKKLSLSNEFLQNASDAIACFKKDTISEYYENHKNSWYQSVSKGDPNYAIYSDEYYIIDALLSYYFYSKQYINRVLGSGIISNEFDGIIVDVGCGLGLSTIHLQDAFRKSTVIGTNVPGLQLDYSHELGANVIQKIEETPRGCIVFASEYFEHFKNPITELANILRWGPSRIIVANSFGATAVGHFPTYDISILEQGISNKSIGRQFNKILRENNYVQEKTTFWNNRPAIWRENNVT